MRTLATRWVTVATNAIKAFGLDDKRPVQLDSRAYHRPRLLAIMRSDRVVIYTDGEFEVVLDRNSLVLCNRDGTYEHHAHFCKKRKNDRYDLHSIQMVIDFERKKKLPTKSEWILRALARITLDDRYRMAIENKLNKLQNHYININKGVVK